MNHSLIEGSDRRAILPVIHLRVPSDLWFELVCFRKKDIRFTARNENDTHTVCIHDVFCFDEVYIYGALVAIDDGYLQNPTKCRSCLTKMAMFDALQSRSNRLISFLFVYNYSYLVVKRLIGNFPQNTTVISIVLASFVGVFVG